ncbi:DUF4856 domain-containing protein [Crocinitomicaceae bacterium]|nr:DUF4856 domain-containing protein [Crocinitomicaceae bacterium]
MIKHLLIISALTLSIGACKKQGCTNETATNYNEKATKDDGSCEYPATNAYAVPSTYSFTDGNGNSTVSFFGQTDRLSQLDEMNAYAESGTTSAITSQMLKDMFSNSNNPFSFVSSKQLKDKCFGPDVAMVEGLFVKIANASQVSSQTASSGQAGTLSSGSSTYLFDENGFDCAEMIEKSVMGAVFMNQALNVYFGPDKMNVDNATAVNTSASEYYTTMEHHWDEAFGYFGVPTDFPTTAATQFWGKYCNSQDSTLGCNELMMSNFLKGRAAISNKVYADRDQSINTIRTTWENISANQAISYMDKAISFYGTDNAKFLHVLTEAYAFSYNLRYSPLETRRMNTAEHAALMGQFGTNLWNLTLQDLNGIKATLKAKY